MYAYLDRLEYDLQVHNVKEHTNVLCGIKRSKHETGPNRRILRITNLPTGGSKEYPMDGELRDLEGTKGG